MENNDDLKELARQLKHPNGKNGTEVAEMMNSVNISMTHHSIKHLKLSDKQHILELGHGNCGHLAHLLSQKDDLRYVGLEMSDLMHLEAQRINKKFAETGQASFVLYDGLKIPFSENSFDKIFTVNTLYFWSDPKMLIAELYRVLKPNGRLNITFGQKRFMEQLPFVQYGFELYDNEKVQKLIETTPFKITHIDTQVETVTNKMGDVVNREFTTVSADK